MGLKRYISLFYLLIGLVSFALAQPVAKFSANITEGCPPLVVSFNNQSTGSGLKYEYDFGNGNKSLLPNPQAIYHAQGKFTVTLIVTDQNGLKDTLVQGGFIEVHKAPKANFAASKTKVCVGESITFSDKTALGDNPLTKVVWDFGDGTVANGNNTSKTYSNSGTYSIAYEVNDAGGCSDETTKINYIVVEDKPKAAFSASETYYCKAPFSVQFNNQSSPATGLTYRWEFGNGNSSSQKSPKETYTTANRSYSVSLEVTSANGCKDKVTQNDLISIFPLKVDFTPSKTKGCENEVIQFTPNITPSQAEFTAKWDFGDGKSSSVKDGVNLYNEPGTYTVSLEVSTSNGCHEKVVKNGLINIYETPKPKFNLKEYKTCVIPFNVDEERLDLQNPRIHQKWFVNDKEWLGPLPIRLHKPGEYRFAIEQSNNGCKGKYESPNVIILEQIDTQIVGGPYQGCVPETFHFTDSSKGWSAPIKDAYWIFKGDTFRGLDFEHEVTEPGKHIIQRHIISSQGCFVSMVRVVSYGKKLMPEFEFDTDTFCNGDSIIVFNKTPKERRDSVHKWEWRFDSTFVSGELDAKFIVDAEPGKYPISLHAFHYGCEEKLVSEGFAVVVGPKASTELIQDECKTDEYILKNTTLGATEFSWQTPDGVRYDTVLHEQKPPGTYTYVLSTYNDKHHCVDTVWDTVYVDVITEVDFELDYKACSPTVVQAKNKTKSPLNFRWVVDGYDDTEARNPAFTFQSGGEYKFTLYGSPSGKEHCIDSMSQTIKIDGPELQAEFSQSKKCLPFKVQLKGENVGQPVDDIYWELDGGFPNEEPIRFSIDSTELTLTRAPYYSDQTYILRLVGEGSGGCRSTKEYRIPVQGIHQIHVEEEVNKYCGGGDYILNAVVNNMYDKWAIEYVWHFPDTLLPVGNVAFKTFDTPGEKPYFIELVDRYGCVTNHYDTIRVGGSSLLLDFSAKETKKECPPFLVEFKNSTIVPPGGSAKYKWIFGTGATSTLESPKHNYLYPGKYSVTLIATDNLGCKDTIEYKDLIHLDGPKGEYSFDKKRGCVPLTVNYSSVVNDSLMMRWDMGDGTVIDGEKGPQHEYGYAGTFIPLMILRDSFGCEAIAPPIDTIRVFDNPIADFKNDLPCVAQGFYLYDLSESFNDSIVSSIWEFNGLHNFQGDTVLVELPQAGMQTIYHKVTTDKGCVDDTIKTVNSSKLSLGAANYDGTPCLPQEISFFHNSSSSHSITERYWMMDGVRYDSDTFSIIADKMGWLSPVLYIKNSFGCFDSVVNHEHVYIEDTLSPPILNVLRVSVNEVDEVLFDIEPDQRFDWKAYEIYQKTNVPNQTYSLLTMKDQQMLGRHQINGLNTLDNSYCFKIRSLNICYTEHKVDSLEEHCTVNVETEADENVIEVSWSPYIGWNDVKEYQVYRSEAEDWNSFEYLATVPGSDTSYIDTAMVCHVEYRYRIQAIEENGDQQLSWSDTSVNVAIWDSELPPNELHRATVERDKFIHIEWNDIPNPKVPLDHWVMEKSEKDTFNYRFAKKYKVEAFDEDDRDVEVDDYSYSFRMYGVDVCGDTSPYSNIGKTILTKAYINSDERPEVSWSPYEGWENRVDYYEVQRKDGPSRFTTLGTVEAEDENHVFTDELTNLNHRAYFCYRVIGYRNEKTGPVEVYSVSNEDCAEVHSWITVPNAFTPNDDGLNDQFNAYGIYIRRYQMTIYNRWGEKLFETFSLDNDWSGYYNNLLMENEAYMYVIHAEGSDGKVYNLNGSFHLIR